MSKIITINRQFGSGGRELGKRLAEELGYAYYDNEIITQIAGRSGLAEDYVSSIVEKKPIVYYPITIGRTFLAHTPAPVDFNTQIYSEQHNIIKELASKSDCVIIGRCADYILSEHDPFKLFVYADMPSRMERCRAKAPTDEKPLSDKQLARLGEQVAYSFWERLADGRTVIRLATSWATTAEAVNSLIEWL